MIRYRFIYMQVILLLITSCNTSSVKTEKDPIDFVDLFIGTAGDHGQNDPAACVPYGMVKLCPDSDPPNHAGYDYGQPRISGISMNRISGVGSRGKGGSLSIRPCAGCYKDEIKEDAFSLWSKQLSKIEVEGDEEYKTISCSKMGKYHSYQNNGTQLRDT